MRIDRAILSVSDKTGIVALARALRAKDIEILSTGGTAKHLAENGIEVTSIAQWSGAPEILGGRVKTLTPRVYDDVSADRHVWARFTLEAHLIKLRRDRRAEETAGAWRLREA